MPGEMRLIVEADTHGHLRDRLTLQQAATRRIDAATEQVGVRRDTERPGEAPHQMRGRHVEDAFRLPQRQRLEPMLVEEVAQIGRNEVRRSADVVDGSIPEMVSEPGPKDGQHDLGREWLPRLLQHAVERMESPDERGILDVGIVDGPADQPFIQDIDAEVQDTLAEPLGTGCPAIVHDVRREDRHLRPGCTAMRGLEVVPDRPLVDDEHRPRVVGVRRIRMVHESCVEHLVDTGDRRLPRADPFAIGSQDGPIVQDPVQPGSLDGRMKSLCSDGS